MARTWILTGSPENYQATKDYDFTVYGDEHSTLASQGQIRPVSNHDAEMLTDRLKAAAGARA